MASLDGFNPDDYKGPKLLPDGVYPVFIINCDLTPRRNGGTDIKVHLKVLNGPSQNEEITFWFAYEIPNATGGMEQALQIGRRTFSDICRAVNVNEPKHTNDLIGKKFKLKLKIKQGKDGVKRNTIVNASPLLTGSFQDAKKAEPQAEEKSLVEQAFEDAPVKKNPFA